MYLHHVAPKSTIHILFVTESFQVVEFSSGTGMVREAMLVPMAVSFCLSTVILGDSCSLHANDGINPRAQRTIRINMATFDGRELLIFSDA